LVVFIFLVVFPVSIILHSQRRKGLHSINSWEATDLGIGKVEGAKKRLAGLRRK